jgi:hypothetical protein
MLASRPDLSAYPEAGGVGLNPWAEPDVRLSDARFYFGMTVAGIALPDDEGLDLPSLDAARRDAMASVAATANDHSAPIEIVVDIRNGEPAPIARVGLSLRCEEP